MYWSRSGNWTDLATFIFLMGILWLGGWMLTAHVARPRARERLLAGLATGLVLFISLSALLGQVLPLQLVFWVASACILLLGVFSVWRSGRRHRLVPDLLKAWPQVVVLLALTLLFALINRGLAIFDDYHNLPLVSTIAAGDFPPHFYLNPTLPFAYHFGLHLFSAGLVRIGGFFPWSAFDLSNAFVLALTIVLVWLWIHRMSFSSWAGILGAVGFAFAGGARWLLLLLPAPLLQRVSANIQLIGSAVPTGPDLLTNLSRPWIIEGGGPIPFPFAHVSGILMPLVQSMTGSGAFPVLGPVLVLLLARQRMSRAQALLCAGVLASLALTAETVFVILWGAMLLSLLAGMIYSRGRSEASARESALVWMLLPALLLALAQGGVISELFRSLVGRLAGGPAVGFYGFQGFSLRWPPALISVHFGSLSIFDLPQLVVALAELGPIPLLFPWVTVLAWKRFRKGDWLTAAFGVGALLAFLAPLVLHYQVERDTTRITATAMTFWLLLGAPMLWKAINRSGPLTQTVIALAYGVTILSGLTLFAIELTAIPQPVQSYFVQGQDARLSSRYWDRLEPQAQVYDRIPFRAVTLFGRPVRAHLSMYVPLPEWQALRENPDPAGMAAAGFDYVYMDEEWWWRLVPEERDAFQQPCVREVDGLIDGNGVFRRLLDVRDCR